MKIAIDLGNRNVKVCLKKGDKIKLDMFQSRFSSEEMLDYTSIENIEFDGVRYSFDKGEYDFEFNKTQKNYMPLLLLALGRALNGDEKKDVDIELMIGAPVEHVAGLREKFKEQLLDKSFVFKYKEDEYKVNIKKVGIIGEGFATYFSIPRSMKEASNIGILDIGGRTVNIATFINGKQDKVCTLNTGILDVKNDILKEYKKEGKDYDIHIIENLIDSNRIEIKARDKKEFVEKIVNEAKLYKIDKDLYEWIIVGGGADDIGEDILNKEFGENAKLENAIFANVKGYHSFMIAKWGE